MRGDAWDLNSVDSNYMNDQNGKHEDTKTTLRHKQEMMGNDGEFV